MRWTVLPLLDVLQRRGVPYKWGFPFGLTATRDAITASLQDKDDLQIVFQTLHPPKGDFPDWNLLGNEVPLPVQQDWQDIHHRWQRIHNMESQHMADLQNV